MAVMKTMLTAIVGLCMVTFSGAFPQNPTTLDPLPAGCRYENQEITETIHKEIFEKECFTENKCVCEDKSEEVCLTYKEDESTCEDFSEEECKDITKKICESVPKVITEPYETEVCRPVTKEECEFHWIEDPPGVKIWAKDQDTCKDFTSTVCDKVIQTRKVQTNVNQTRECACIKHCSTILKKRCTVAEVERTHCTTEVFQECIDVSEEKCIDIHKKVPTQVTRTKAIKKCDNDLSSGSNNLEIIDAHTNQ